MKVVVARALGMCFGVRDAIDLAHRLAAQGPLTVAGELVHNRQVNDELAARGVRIARDAESVLATSLDATVSAPTSAPVRVSAPVAAPVAAPAPAPAPASSLAPVVRFASVPPREVAPAPASASASVSARVDGPETVDASAPRRILLTAHGVSDALKAELASSGHTIFDATCPLVSLAHRALAQLVEDGFHPTVIGKADHVEVRGLLGDHRDGTVLETEADVAKLAGRSMIGIIAQTTQPIAWVESMVALVRRRCPEAQVRFVDTVCQPTKARQDAVRELAGEGVDMIVVVGGRHSNNSRKLVDQALALRIPTHLVEDASELDPTWFVRVRRVGLTAGTSTPQATIDAVEEWLAAHEPALAGREPASSSREGTALRGGPVIVPDPRFAQREADPSECDVLPRARTGRLAEAGQRASEMGRATTRRPTGRISPSRMARRSMA